jgi:hypothetical protein
MGAATADGLHRLLTVAVGAAIASERHPSGSKSRRHIVTKVRSLPRRFASDGYDSPRVGNLDACSGGGLQPLLPRVHRWKPRDAWESTIPPAISRRRVEVCAGRHCSGLRWAVRWRLDCRRVAAGGREKGKQTVTFYPSLERQIQTTAPGTFSPDAVAVAVACVWSYCNIPDCVSLAAGYVWLPPGPSMDKFAWDYVAPALAQPQCGSHVGKNPLEFHGGSRGSPVDMDFRGPADAPSLDDQSTTACRLSIRGSPTGRMTRSCTSLITSAADR